MSLMPSKPRNGVILEPTIDKYGCRGLRIELIQKVGLNFAHAKV